MLCLSLFTLVSSSLVFHPVLKSYMSSVCVCVCVSCISSGRDALFSNCTPEMHNSASPCCILCSALHSSPDCQFVFAVFNVCPQTTFCLAQCLPTCSNPLVSHSALSAPLLFRFSQTPNSSAHNKPSLRFLLLFCFLSHASACIYLNKHTDEYK